MVHFKDIINISYPVYIAIARLYRLRLIISGSIVFRSKDELNVPLQYEKLSLCRLTIRSRVIMK